MSRNFNFIRPIVAPLIPVWVFLVSASLFGQQPSVSLTPNAQVPSSERLTRVKATSGYTRVRSKAEQTVLPSVTLSNATVAQCLDFLRQASREHDKSDFKEAVNLVLKVREEDSAGVPLVTIHAQNISILEAMEEIASQTGLDYRIAPDAVEIGKPNEIVHELPKRDFLVPPSLFPDCKVELPKESELARYVRFDVRSRLSEWGVTFKYGGTAYYFPATNFLQVSDTSESLDNLDQVIKDFITSHPFPPEPNGVATEVPRMDRNFGVWVPNWRAMRAEPKLNRIFLNFELNDATCGEAFDLFFKKLKQSDTLEDERRKGVVGRIATSVAADSHRRISLTLASTPAIQVLKYLTAALKLDFQFLEDGSVWIDNLPDSPRPTKRIYLVPTERIDIPTGSILGPDGIKYSSVQELFSTMGVEFPPGSSAGLNVDGEIVILTTPRGLAVADVVVAALIDANGKALSPEALKVLRAIILDAQANGRIREPRFSNFGEG